MIIAIVIILGLFLSLIGFITDFMWFRELGYVSVFFTKLFTQIKIGVPTFVVVTFLAYIYLKLLKRGYFIKVSSDEPVNHGRLNLISWGLAAAYGAITTFFTVTKLWFDFLQFVNSTSFGKKDPLYDMDISCWEKVTNLNMNGTVYPSMIFGKVMAKQGKGCIINVSSMAAYSAITRVPGYSAAKTAVANFTQWLASEMALKYGDGIRVNAIAPGFFIGDQNRRVLINPDGSLTDRSKKVLAKTPMKRFGDIKELNGAVHFLCSEAASFVTGAMLPIDGGFSAFSGV